VDSQPDWHPYKIRKIRAILPLWRQAQLIHAPGRLGPIARELGDRRSCGVKHLDADASGPVGIHIQLQPWSLERERCRSQPPGLLASLERDETVQPKVSQPDPSLSRKPDVLFGGAVTFVIAAVVNPMLVVVGNDLRRGKDHILVPSPGWTARHERLT